MIQCRHVDHSMIFATSNFIFGNSNKTGQEHSDCKDRRMSSAGGLLTMATTIIINSVNEFKGALYTILA